MCGQRTYRIRENGDRGVGAFQKVLPCYFACSSSINMPQQAEYRCVSYHLSRLTYTYMPSDGFFSWSLLVLNMLSRVAKPSNIDTPCPATLDSGYQMGRGVPKLRHRTKVSQT